MDLVAFKKQCFEYMFWSYGTAEVFKRREAALRSRRIWITYFGIIGPLALGAVLSTLGANSHLLPAFIAVAGIIGVVQLVFSAWALVARWDERYLAAQNGVRENTILYNRFKTLQDINSADYLREFLEIQADYNRQETIDNGQSITQKEKRFANHEALRYFGKPCHICKIAPTSTKPSQCDGCGNY